VFTINKYVTERYFPPDSESLTNNMQLEDKNNFYRRAWNADAV